MYLDELRSLNQCYASILLVIVSMCVVLWLLGGAKIMQNPVHRLHMCEVVSLDPQLGHK